MLDDQSRSFREGSLETGYGVVGGIYTRDDILDVMTSSNDDTLRYVALFCCWKDATAVDLNCSIKSNEKEACRFQSNTEDLKSWYYLI